MSFRKSAVCVEVELGNAMKRDYVGSEKFADELVNSAAMEELLKDEQLVAELLEIGKVNGFI